MKLELTDAGRKILGDRQGQFDVIYHNGPILMPAKSTDVPPYEPLAWFRTEVAEHGSPAGVMVNSPAIVGGRCGEGRVLCISPHPEQTEGLDEIVIRAAQWAARKR